MFPKTVFSGMWRHGHCQGIAVDPNRKEMYFSFTTALVRTTLTGEVLGSATGLVGHLGCIAWNPDDGRVYGSLEYKNDAIGKGIAAMLGDTVQHEDAFYIARFDVEKITAVGLDACEAGIMQAACLPDVAADYNADTPQGHHRYGCSGIDGLTFAPPFGAPRDAARRLYVAYGVYSDLNRTDNDHQVILGYDQAHLEPHFGPLSQRSMHHNGCAPDERLFLYTGNTRYGIQNLEFDPTSGNVLVAVYCGEKPTYPNWPMFIIDGHKAPVEGPLKGIPGESGKQLTLLAAGEHDAASGTYGWLFPMGATGICALGDGLYYFSHDEKRVTDTDTAWCSTAKLYRWDGVHPFVEVE